jgi:hypothetical protein
MSSCCDFCRVKDKTKGRVEKAMKPRVWKNKSPDLELAKVAYKNRKG